MSRIVVGVDGSEESKLALEWALEEARLRDCELEAVYAYDYTPEWSSMSEILAAEGVMLEVPEATTQERQETSAAVALRHAQEALRHIVSGTDASGVVVKQTVVDNHKPSHYLVEHSRDAMMLVVGARGRGAVQRVILGSVSTYCVHHASCPTVVVKGSDS